MFSKKNGWKYADHSATDPNGRKSEAHSSYEEIDGHKNVTRDACRKTSTLKLKNSIMIDNNFPEGRFWITFG